MKTIYLVRHGDVENPDGIFYSAAFPLSTRGVRQAQKLGEDMAATGLKPTRIVASPHVRTRETAEIIAQAIDGHVETDERLVEWKTGSWIGRPLAEFRQAAGYDDPPPFRLKLDDVETFEQISERMRDCIVAELAKLEDGECSLLVGHREPLAIAIISLRHEPDWRNVPLLDIPKPCAWKLDFDGNVLTGASKAFDTSGVN
jgi:broad specificity phosphatase PhoE